MSKQTQTNVQVRKKGLDDVFHRAIIALERLEVFLMMANSNQEQVNITQTGIKTSRDLHDDEKNLLCFFKQNLMIKKYLIKQWSIS